MRIIEKKHKAEVIQIAENNGFGALVVYPEQDRFVLFHRNVDTDEWTVAHRESGLDKLE